MAAAYAKRSRFLKSRSGCGSGDRKFAESELYVETNIRWMVGSTELP